MRNSKVWKLSARPPKAKRRLKSILARNLLKRVMKRRAIALKDRNNLKNPRKRNRTRKNIMMMNMGSGRSLKENAKNQEALLK